MESKRLRHQDIEAANNLGIEPHLISPFSHLAEQSGLTFREICLLARNDRLADAVGLAETRRRQKGLRETQERLADLEMRRHDPAWKLARYGLRSICDSCGTKLLAVESRIRAGRCVDCAAAAY